MMTMMIMMMMLMVKATERLFGTGYLLGVHAGGETGHGNQS